MPLNCSNCGRTVQGSTGIIDEIRLNLNSGKQLITFKIVCDRSCLQEYASHYPCDTCGTQLNLLRDRIAYETLDSGETLLYCVSHRLEGNMPTS